MKPVAVVEWALLAVGGGFLVVPICWRKLAARRRLAPALVERGVDRAGVVLMLTFWSLLFLWGAWRGELTTGHLPGLALFVVLLLGWARWEWSRPLPLDP